MPSLVSVVTLLSFLSSGAAALSISGPLESVEEVPIRPKVAGRVMSVKVQLHAPVESGQVLAVIDTTEIEAAAEQTKAQAGSSGAEAGHSGAQAAELKKQAGRAKQLEDMGVAPSSEPGSGTLDDMALLASEKKEDAAEESSKKQVEHVATVGRLRRARILAPADGWVTVANLQAGETILPKAGQEPFFVVATDLSELRLNATLSKETATALSVDQPVRFAVAAQEGATFPGRVAQIQELPRSEGSPAFYLVEMRVSNPARLLWPGDKAVVSWGAASAPTAALAPGEPDPSKLPKAFGPDDRAVVIGVERYPDLPASEFSRADAELVKRFLLAMGMRESAIQLLVDEKASYAGIRKVLETWLPNNLAAGGRVFVYYSGHGAPDPATGEAYLVPADGDPNYLGDTAYPIKQLFEKLGGLKASEVFVVMDSCFSGAGGRSLLAKGARPLVMSVPNPALGARMAVLTATRKAQISTSSREKRHGVLTYHFLKALEQGKSSLAEAYIAAAPAVQDEARSLNVEQDPELRPAPETIKGRFLFRTPR